MDQEGIRSVLQDVFGPNIAMKEVNGWVSIQCPLAMYKAEHSRGRDTNASAGVSIKDTETSVFNCLRGDTEVRTYEGTVCIADLAGTTPILQMPNGCWSPAPIRSFGLQKLYKVCLSRNSRKKIIYATSGHRWFSQPQGGGNYRERTTAELRPKQRLKSVAIFPGPEIQLDTRAVLHGVIYGDGTAHVNGKHGRVNLYGEKAQLHELLSTVATNSGYTPEGVPYVSGGYAKFKRLPQTTNLRYLLNFLAGWLATDGAVDGKGNVSLSNADEGVLEWVRDAAYAHGIESYGITEQWRIGYGNEPTAIYSIRFVSATLPTSIFLREDQRENFLAGAGRKYARWQWQVVSVEETDIVEEVFCAVVPKYHAFVLDGGLVTGNCFTCHTRVPFQVLIKQYANYTGEDLDDLIEELEDEAYLGPRTLPSWESRYKEQVTIPVLDKAIYLDLYDSAAGHPYLQERGISNETAELLQLKVDPEDPADGTERILFPVFGPNGDLHGMSGRDVTGEARLKVRDYGGLKKAFCLLGSHLIADHAPDKVLLVEGLFDYANSWEQGYPAVAVMHSTVTAAQSEILKSLSLPIYSFMDDDAAGQSGTKIAAELLKRHTPFMRVRWPSIWIEDERDEDGGHWVKDPGELLAEDFQKMIDNARLC